MIDNFIHIFFKDISFSDQQGALLKQVFSTKMVRKNQVLLRAGEVARQSFFVIKGCLRSYTVDEAGAEHILQFAIEGWIISDLYSFLTGEPGASAIDAIEDSEVYIIDPEGREKLLDAVPGMERTVRQVMENNYIANQRRVNSLLSDSLEQRYIRFIDAYPQIARRVPQRMLASYLGTTPETISRIRKQLSIKG